MFRTSIVAPPRNGWSKAPDGPTPTSLMVASTPFVRFTPAPRASNVNVPWPLTTPAGCPSSVYISRVTPAIVKPFLRERLLSSRFGCEALLLLHFGRRCPRHLWLWLRDLGCEALLLLHFGRRCPRHLWLWLRDLGSEALLLLHFGRRCPRHLWLWLRDLGSEALLLLHFGRRCPRHLWLWLRDLGSEALLLLHFGRRCPRHLWLWLRDPSSEALLLLHFGPPPSLPLIR